MGMFLISLKKQPLWKNMRHEFLIFSQQPETAVSAAPEKYQLSAASNIIWDLA